MKTHVFLQIAASGMLVGLMLTPAWAQVSQPARSEISYSAEIERIEFVGIPVAQQKLFLDGLGVRAGDKLSLEIRQRIGRELGRIRKGTTFMYKAGSKSGMAKLIIQADC